MATVSYPYVHLMPLLRLVLRLLPALFLAWAAARAANPPNLLASVHGGTILTAEDDALLDDLERASFRYFVEQSDPLTGLVRDRAHADGSPSEGKASISAEGFALASWSIAAQRGWVDRLTAAQRVRQMLRFLVHKAPRVHGFFYHFMEMKTGERAWQCELSSIDTALFLAGAIVAREYFKDPEITELVNQLYREADWKWFLNGGTTVSMSWHDEGGFSRFRWSFYAEHMMMSFLGMGAPANALPLEYWHAWKRQPAGTYAGFHFIQGPPLFIHQFAHAFVDFRDKRDAYADYYRNSLLATLAQRQFCMDLRSEFPSWGERLWGLTASDSAEGYKAWGGPPRTSEFNTLDGTIVPCATAGSVPFAPYETLMVLHHIRTVYGDRVWKRYSFVDAFNPETGWVNPDVIGIDLGISLLQAENARTGFVWSQFMKAPEVQRALTRAGFVSTSRNFSWAEREQLRRLAATAWRSLDNAPVEADTLGLRLTAVPAAQALGLIDGGVAVKRARALLENADRPTEEIPVAEYAAGLVTLRQAIPSLAPDTTRLLEAIDWATLTPTSTKLGSESRLATFFKIALRKTASESWTNLVRTPEKRGPIYVLSPAAAPDQLRPELWLDESTTIAGASAAQLAYSIAVAPTLGEQTGPIDAADAALLLDHFPAELLARMQRTPQPAGWIDAAPLADRAALVISVANLLVPTCIRDWFQSDPLVRSGRGSIPEFGADAFGSETSLFWRYELMGPQMLPPERAARALPSSLPREQWHWVHISGLEFQDTPADVRADDPVLELYFAFTWDHVALHFHATAIDTPEGYRPPHERQEQVELLIDPKSDGYVWGGADDFHFVFRANGDVFDLNHNHAVPVVVRRTKQGYTVDADIPWSQLGLTPTKGLSLGVTTAVATGGRYEWEP